MIDLNYLKKAYSEVSTDNLIDFYRMKQESFIPQAASVIKDELEIRGVNINGIWEKDISKSVSTEFFINNAIDCNITKNMRVIGYLYFTSRGIYFFHIRCINPALFMYFGLLGIAINEIIYNLFNKKEDIEEKINNIPPHLLARNVKDSIIVDIENVDLIVYGKYGGMRVVDKNKNITEFGFDKNKVPMLENWVNAHGIKHEINEGFYGIIYFT